MKTILSIIFFGFILLASCQKDDIPKKQTDANGVIISMPYQWKRTLHLSTPVSSSAIRAPIFYKGNIVIPITNGANNRLLAMINSNNGELIWKWDDRYQPTTEYEDISYYYQYNNLLTYQVGGRSYCINLDDGSTFWKNRKEVSFSEKLYGSGNTYYTFSESETMYKDFSESVVYKGNLQTGEITEYIIPNYTMNVIAPSDRIGDVTAAIPYMYNNVQHLAVIWQEPMSTYDWQSFLGLFNCETEQWVYEKSIMIQPNYNGVLLAPPVIYNGKIYADIGKELVCHDLSTGQQVWNKQFTQDFMFSGFIIAENKIIASNEDQILYCLNPDNGNIIWSTQGSGTSSRLAHLNGIVYFMGGGDGKLHAVNVGTGKTVWLLEANKIDGSIFASYNPVYVFPAEGGKPARVIALTLGNACCFEAYQ